MCRWVVWDMHRLVYMNHPHVSAHGPGSFLKSQVQRSAALGARQRAVTSPTQMFLRLPKGKAGHKVDLYVLYLGCTESEGQNLASGGISVPQKEDFLVVRTQIEGQEN